jgi:hypothetical protein
MDSQIKWLFTEYAKEYIEKKKEEDVKNSPNKKKENRKSVNLSGFKNVLSIDGFFS